MTKKALLGVALGAALFMAACGEEPAAKKAENQAPASPAPVATPAPAPPAPSVAPAPVEPPVKSQPKSAPRKSAEPVKPAPPRVATAPSPSTPAAPAKPPQPSAPTTTARNDGPNPPVFLPTPAPPPPPPDENSEPPRIVRQTRDTSEPREREPREPIVRTVTVPSGTLIPVRMIDAVDSKTDRVGQTFKASLEQDVVVNNRTVFRKGDDAFVKLTRVQSAGKVSGQSELQLQLDRLVGDSGSYTIESNVYQTQGSSQGQKAVRNVGIGAVVGAAIGAIAGGGKGAAIGAGAGAGAGAAGTILTKDQVRVDSETALTFRLEKSLDVNLR